MMMYAVSPGAHVVVEVVVVVPLAKMHHFSTLLGDSSVV